jgi:hypothetical protein
MAIAVAAKPKGVCFTGSIADSIARLRAHGIWLGAQVQAFALKEEAKLTL